MPKGGKRPGAGRPSGARNKVTKEVKDIAQEYGEEAVTTLVSIMRSGEAPFAARVAASKEILDRAYGKAVQSIDHSSTDGSMTPSGLSHFYGEDPDDSTDAESGSQAVLEGEGS